MAPCRRASHIDVACADAKFTLRPSVGVAVQYLSSRRCGPGQRGGVSSKTCRVTNQLESYIPLLVSNPEHCCLAASSASCEGFVPHFPTPFDLNPYSAQHVERMVMSSAPGAVMDQSWSRSLSQRFEYVLYCHYLPFFSPHSRDKAIPRAMMNSPCSRFFALALGVHSPSRSARSVVTTACGHSPIPSVAPPLAYLGLVFSPSECTLRCHASPLLFVTPHVALRPAPAHRPGLAITGKWGAVPADVRPLRSCTCCAAPERRQCRERASDIERSTRAGAFQSWHRTQSSPTAGRGSRAW